MINANELRIGNTVIRETDDAGIHEIIIKTGGDIENYANYFPILITDEWLLKFGFEKDVQHECFVIWKAECGIAFRVIGHSLADELQHIRYVHQLQNLYFALTGEELVIKVQ